MRSKRTRVDVVEHETSPAHALAGAAGGGGDDDPAEVAGRQALPELEGSVGMAAVGAGGAIVGSTLDHLLAELLALGAAELVGDSVVVDGVDGMVPGSLWRGLCRLRAQKRAREVHEVKITPACVLCMHRMRAMLCMIA